MLLTVSFGKQDKSDPKPLSPREWTDLRQRLKERNLDPSVLLKNGWKEHLTGIDESEQQIPRLEGLLKRGMALGLALEKWQRAGIWFITRMDQDYPLLINSRLKESAPPVLFGVGDRNLLNPDHAIAVVGTRDAYEDDLKFAEKVGVDAADWGSTVVSGGARGVDQKAMLGALNNQGTAIGVLAHSLIREATSLKYRKYLQDKLSSLVLVSACNPDAGFNKGNAFARNKYIYCMAKIAFVVSSKHGQGGTWAGAEEAIREQWLPVFVKRPAQSGNPALVDNGAKWVTDLSNSVKVILDETLSGQEFTSRTDILSSDENSKEGKDSNIAIASSEKQVASKRTSKEKQIPLPGT